MSTNKHRTTRDTAVIVVSSLLFVRLLFGLLPGVFDTWNSQVVDQLFVFRSTVTPSLVPYDSSVVHVDVTDSTVQALTGSYLERKHFAQVARNLGELKSAVQIWDFIFRAPTDPVEDSLFIRANLSAGNAYYGVAFGLGDEPMKQRPPRPQSHWDFLSETKWHVKTEGDISSMYWGTNPIVTFPELSRSAKGIGYLSLRFDRDGVFRRAPLLIRYEDGFYPSFPFHAICDYLGVTPDRVVVRPGTSVTLVGATKPGQAPADIVIPVDEQCCLIINFIGPWDRMLHYNFADIYRVSDDRDAMEFDWQPRFQGKLVVVDDATTGAADWAPVPTDNNYPLSGLHANVLHTILGGHFLREAGTLEGLVYELIIIALVAFFSLRFTSRGLWIGALALLIGFITFAVGLFLYSHVIVHIVRPVVMIIVSVFGVLAYRFINEEREKEAFRRSFESYLPPSIVKKMVGNPESMFDGQKKELTILFSDIKSFTTYSSTMTADQIQKFLGEYFDAMVDIVFKYEGTVDKYIGDGLMAFWGAPEAQPDHAVRCAKAAIEMQIKCRELKVKWEQEGLFPIKIRVGINTGDVVVGNMGTPKKLAYTVLGAPVNLANRLESNAPVEGILVSARTNALIKDHIRTIPHPAIKVKGLEEDIEVYEVPVEAPPAGA